MAIYYVDNTASGAGTPGDSGDPYELISNLPAIADGDEVYFYHDQTHLMGANKFLLSIGVGATFGRYGGTEQPVIDCGAENYFVRFRGPVSPAIVENIKFINDGNQNSEGVIHFRDAGGTSGLVNNCWIISQRRCIGASAACAFSAGLTITNNTLTTTDGGVTGGTYAIYLNPVAVGTDLLIDGNTVNDTAGVSDNDSYGIWVYAKTGAGQLVISNNTVYDVMHGIRLGNTDDTVITDNTVYGCRDGLVYPSGNGYGIRVYGTTTNCLISDNILYENDRHISLGSSGTGANDCQIVGNTLIEPDVNCIDVVAFGTGNLIAHNHFKHKPVKTGHAFVIQTAAATTEVELKNNVFEVEPPAGFILGDSEFGNVQAVKLKQNFNLCDINNNQYHLTANAAGDTAYYGGIEGADKAAWADWVTALVADVEITGEESAGTTAHVTISAAAPYALHNDAFSLLGAGESLTGINDAGEYGTPPNIGHETVAARLLFPRVACGITASMVSSLFEED